MKFSGQQTTDELFGHQVHDHQPTCWYDLLAVCGSIHFLHRRISDQPGLYHSLLILLVQHHGQTPGCLVQHQVFEQVEKCWELLGIYRAQHMWLVGFFGVGLCWFYFCRLLWFISSCASGWSNEIGQGCSIGRGSWIKLYRHVLKYCCVGKFAVDEMVDILLWEVSPFRGFV